LDCRRRPKCGFGAGEAAEAYAEAVIAADVEAPARMMSWRRSGATLNAFVVAPGRMGGDAR
jgi:hypothetical protein